MGIKEVVVSWDAEALIRNARRQGYRVYAEVPVGKAADTDSGRQENAIWRASSSIRAIPSPARLRMTSANCESAYPALPVLVLERQGENSRR